MYPKLKSSPNMFLRNVSILVSGNIIAQLLSFISQPIATRLFTPTEYGTLASIQAIVSIYIIFSAFCYERAIVIASSRVEAKAISTASIKITLLTWLVFNMILFIPSIWHMLFNFKSSWWAITLTSIWMLTASLTSIFTNLHNFDKNYKFLSIIKLPLGIATIFFTLAAGFLKYGFLGLLAAAALSSLTGFIIISKQYFYQLLGLFKNNSKEILIKYLDFPKYQLISALLDTISLQIIVILLNKSVGTEIAGQYALANRVLAIPLILIGGAFAQVFYKEFAERYSTNNHPKEFLFNTWKKLALLGVTPCIILFFWGEPLFSLTFGHQWQMAGWFAKYLCIMTFLMLINSPTSTALIIMRKQKWVFIITIIYFITRISSLLLIPHVGLSRALLSYVLCEICAIILYNIPIIVKLKDE